MVNEEPTVSPTSQYSIGEAAKILGIHRNTLRKYTNTGPAGIRCKFKKSNNRKVFTGFEIVKFWKSCI